MITGNQIEMKNDFHLLGGPWGVSAAPPAKRSRGPQWTTHGPSGLAPAIELSTAFGYKRDRDPNSELPPGGSP